MSLRVLLFATVAGALHVGPHRGPTARGAVPQQAPAPTRSDGAAAGQATALLLGATLLSTVEPAFAGGWWIAPTKAVLQPALTVGTVFFLMRVVLSWFPSYNLKELPWSVVATPTEPFLKPTRKLVPPVAGVDISPIVWVSILSFFSETLTGPQGLLTILQKN